MGVIYTIHVVFKCFVYESFSDEQVEQKMCLKKSLQKSSFSRNTLKRTAELSVAQTVHMWGDSALMFRSSVLSSVWINSIESSTVRILRAVFQFQPEICLWSQNRTSNPSAARWGSFWNLLAWNRKSWHRYPPAKPEVCQAPRLIQQQANGLPDWVTTNKTDLKLLNFICIAK